MTSMNQNGLTAVESTGSNNQGGIAHLLARSNILELQPYRCARDDYSTGILLDANENSLGPPSSVKERMQQQSSTIVELERYPDPYQIPLKERLIQFRGYNENTNQSLDKKITANHIFVGVGSDEAIDLLMRIFCIPQQDSILTTPPTYGMYKVCAKVNDVSIVTAPLTPQFDVEIEKVGLLVCFIYLIARWVRMYCNS
jgi:histidinol-phosphate aminotransferase